MHHHPTDPADTVTDPTAMPAAGTGADQVPPGLDPAALAATLRATIADLETHIQARAEAIAAPRVAAAERAAAARVDELAAEHDRERTRLEDLVAEQRRQLTAIEQLNVRLAYAARHLPAAVKALTIGVWNDPNPPTELAAWAARVDAAAADARSKPEPTTPVRRVTTDGRAGSRVDGAR